MRDLLCAVHLLHYADLYLKQKYNVYLGISAKHKEVWWNRIRLRDLLLELLCFER